MTFDTTPLRKRILVACEFSGTVRDAFTALGWDAWSCDLLPSEKPGNHHQCDAISKLKEPFYGDGNNYDLLVGHPPCTYLCNSGVRWLVPGGALNQERHQQMKKACDFFAALYWADVPRVAIENPVMHKYARDYLKSVWKISAHSFTIQPWQHGEPETKRTCFWTRNLPPLVPSNVVTGRQPRVHHASPGPDRWKERSRTLPGIAKAMANQWTKALNP